jgi:hypothetical protein
MQFDDDGFDVDDRKEEKYYMLGEQKRYQPPKNPYIDESDYVVGDLSEFNSNLEEIDYTNLLNEYNLNLQTIKYKRLKRKRC